MDVALLALIEWPLQKTLGLEVLVAGSWVGSSWFQLFVHPVLFHKCVLKKGVLLEEQLKQTKAVPGGIQAPVQR